MYLSKKRKTAIAVLLSAILYCLFSTIAQATQSEIKFNKINTFEMYGYDESMSGAWRSYSYTLSNEYTSLTTNYIVYGQIRERITFTFDNISIKTVKLKFDIIVRNSSINTNYNCTVRIPSGNGEIKEAQIQLVDEIYNEDESLYYQKYRYEFEENNYNINTNSLTLYYNISFVSSTIKIENFSCIFNDSIYMAIDEYTNSFNDLKTIEENLYKVFDNNGLSSLPNRLQNMANHYSQMKTDMQLNGYFVEKSYFDNIFNQSTIFVAMMNITMLISVCSYILFGKLR